MIGMAYVSFIALAAVPAMSPANTEEYPKPPFDADGKINESDISYQEWLFVGTPFLWPSSRSICSDA